MISRCTSNVSKEDVVFHGLLYSDSRCSQACNWRCQVLPGRQLGLVCVSLALLAFPLALLGWLLAVQDLSLALRDMLLVLPDLSLVYWDFLLAPSCAPRHVVGANRLVTRASRCSQVHPKFSLLLQSVFELTTITPMVLLDQWCGIPVTLKAGPTALVGSDTLLNLTHLSLYYTSSKTLMEAPSN